MKATKPQNEKNKSGSVGEAAGAAGTLLVFLMGAGLWLMRDIAPDTFLLLLQEDEVFEWYTFWGFIAGAILYALAARAQYRRDRTVPWFLAGLAVFCLLVALEEISWGQRVLGYRPPEYFLANNYQQEFNYHNIIDSSLRQWGLLGLLVAYGMALPGAFMIRPLGALLSRLAFVPPPRLIMPGFIVMVVLYVLYPWVLTGEAVEAMMAVGFTAAAAANLARFAPPEAKHPASFYFAVATLVAVLLGVMSAWQSRAARSANPALITQTRTEATALLQDVLALHSRPSARPPTNCGMHRRAYTFVTQQNQPSLNHGRFAALQEQGLPEERAAFFLDPWNSPYWIRHACTPDRMEARIIVYSMGPNRRRDTTGSLLLGDDIGAFIDMKRNAPRAR